MRAILILCLLVGSALAASKSFEDNFVYEVIENVSLQTTASGVSFSFGDVFGEEWKGELEPDTKTWGANEGPSYQLGRKEAAVQVPNSMYVGKMQLKSGECEMRLDVRRNKLEKGLVFSDRIYYLAKASDYFHDDSQPEDSYVVYGFEEFFPDFSGDGTPEPAAPNVNGVAGGFGAIQGDNTYSTFPGIRLYGDNELLKAFSSVGDATTYINSIISSVNGILSDSSMAQLTVIGSIEFLSAGDTTVSTSPWTVTSNFLDEFGDYIDDLCENNNAYDPNVPDMALLFTGNEFSDHGAAFSGTACGISYVDDVAPSVCHCTAMKGRAEDAGGVVDMCTSVSNAAYRSRYQIHYAAHQIGHLLGASHMSTNNYLYNYPNDKDWIMVDPGDYDGGFRPVAPARFHSSSRTQCLESCLYLWGFGGPTFLDHYDS